ncbi:MAG TPA: glycosyltransferase [Gammaproteobacteria bacterium]|nr:glycosyltransferase [Gammaproteobacteria bacterium]
MRALILTSQLGHGHTRAAEAIEAALAYRDPATCIHRLDLWSLVDAKAADALKEGYLELATEHPEVYDQLYHSHTWYQLLGKQPVPETVARVVNKIIDRWFPPNKSWLAPRTSNMDQALLLSLLEMLTGRSSPVGEAIIRPGVLMWMRALLLRRLKAELVRYAPDILIATQVYLAALMNVAKRRGDFRNMPMLCVMTDYGIHEFWVQFGTRGAYCVATESIADRLRARGVPDERVHVTGIPLMPEFSDPPSQSDARRQLGLDPEGRLVLVTGGWFGIGVSQAVKGLMDCALDCQVLVTTGRADNEDVRMLKSLEQRFPHRLHLIEWSDQMPQLLRAADVVVGKPGGLSVAEALACGRPFIATTSLGGQEGFNLRFLEAHGVGREMPPEALFDGLHALLASPGELKRAQTRALKLGCRDGADRIAQLAAASALHQNRDAVPWITQKR